MAFSSQYPIGRPPLAPAAFAALPSGSIRPKGWLLGQLRLAAMGLTGHLDEIWPDVGPNSAWLGGSGEDWERGPYYLDGLVPLAYTLNDDRLIAKARRWMESTIASQRQDGSFGPASRPDWWSRMPMLKALAQYHEATGDERVLDLMSRYFRYELASLPRNPLESWGQARGGDNLFTVYWLHDRTGEAFLLDLAETLFQQSVDWTSILLDLPYRSYQTAFDHRVHVVNVAMSPKLPGLFFRQSGEARHRAAVHAGIVSLMRHHGLAHGMFSGDEWLAGLEPHQGVETCAVVEFMFSLEVLTRTLGDAEFADRLERVAFNALPACQTPSLWGHQYDQQANQVLVSRASRRWTSNRDDSNLFGLEPNFGCCTANLHQGWPKLANSLWAGTPDGGLASLVYAPCSVSARVAAGESVVLSEETDYPFGESIRLTLHTARPVAFPLVLRVPGWASSASLCLPEESPRPLSAGQFHRIEREWRDGDVVDLKLPMSVRTGRWIRDSVTVERGPLVFALPIGEAWVKVGGAEPCPDWEIHPTSPWNYGLDLSATGSLEVATTAPGYQPFDQINAPVRIKAMARRLPGWTLVDNSAGPPPQSPARTPEPLEEVSLTPYGCARLRVAQLPEVTGSRDTRIG